MDNFFTRIVFNKLLPYMPRETIQTFMGFEALSPIEQFAAKGYNDFLFSDLKLNSEDTALVLGGYLGHSILKFREAYDCKVIALEPVPDFAKTLTELFRLDDKVQVLDLAVSDFNGNSVIGIEGESTGTYSNSINTLEVPTREISEFLEELEFFPRVIEMNIEGGEYACLESLIETGVINRVQVLLVQFHRHSMRNELSKAQIRLGLENTHSCIFDFPYVWERWDRNP